MEAKPAFTPKRGRPTPDQAAAISEAILEAATELFLADGFERTAMEAVAARAGVPKSTLYKRYPDKVSLLRAVIQRRVFVWESVTLERQRMLTDDLEQRLKQYVRWMVGWMASAEVRAFARLAWSAWSDPEDVATRLDVFRYGDVVDFFERDIREFGPKDGINARDPRRVATMIVAMVGGWLDSRGTAAPASQEEADEVADTTVDLLLHGKAAW